MQLLHRSNSTTSLTIPTRDNSQGDGFLGDSSAVCWYASTRKSLARPIFHMLLPGLFLLPPPHTLLWWLCTLHIYLHSSLCLWQMLMLPEGDKKLSYGKIITGFHEKSELTIAKSGMRIRVILDNVQTIMELVWIPSTTVQEQLTCYQKLAPFYVIFSHTCA